MPPCHGGDRRFESGPGLKMRSPVGGNGLRRLAPETVRGWRRVSRKRETGLDWSSARPRIPIKDETCSDLRGVFDIVGPVKEINLG